MMSKCCCPCDCTALNYVGLFGRAVRLCAWCEVDDHKNSIHTERMCDVCGRNPVNKECDPLCGSNTCSVFDYAQRRWGKLVAFGESPAGVARVPNSWPPVVPKGLWG